MAGPPVSDRAIAGYACFADPPQVELRPLDDVLLTELLEVAITDANPEEVIPPVEGPPGWIAARVDFFLRFHRDRFAGLDGPQRSVMFAILAGQRVVGMIRMSRTDDAAVFETGMWLGRSARGRGLGTAAVRALLTEADRAGASVVVAQTTPGNTAAVGALRQCGAELIVDGEQVRARLAIPPR